ncbi:MAG: hypothetical protein KDA32_00835 [Phycisphaerales bacterium]|nr:hypothetical protein [Phycisphaerales bacterium]
MSALSLFEGFGVELEYMIVDADSLNVLPIADTLMQSVSGRFEDVERGDLAWSNELVAHVIELKTNGPAANLDGLGDKFQREVAYVNERLAPFNARLMPTAMHPWMNPLRETRIWPHEYNDVYEAFHRIFDCRGHGWSNLQSTHLNLPFANDDEFARLHAAIRLTLPLLPALAASSPIVDGRVAAFRDVRLEFYRHNSDRVPLATGHVIPERVYSRGEYDAQVFQPLYRAIAPLDTANVLQEEFLNARGAIARFSRGAIEIRVLDIQERPVADIALLRLIVATIRALTDEQWTSLDQQKPWAEERLERLLLATIRDAGAAVIDDADYLHAFGMGNTRAPAAGIWRHLCDALAPQMPQDEMEAVKTVLDHGTLSERIVNATGTKPDRERLSRVYAQLCDCLAHNTAFLPDGI